MWQVTRRQVYPWSPRPVVIFATAVYFFFFTVRRRRSTCVVWMSGREDLLGNVKNCGKAAAKGKRGRVLDLRRRFPLGPALIGELCTRWPPANTLLADSLSSSPSSATSVAPVLLSTSAASDLVLSVSVPGQRSSDTHVKSFTVTLAEPLSAKCTWRRLPWRRMFLIDRWRDTVVLVEGMTHDVI